MWGTCWVVLAARKTEQAGVRIEHSMCWRRGRCAQRQVAEGRKAATTRARATPPVHSEIT
eukprot:8643703-Pyramimonas_sp.AAC.1